MAMELQGVVATHATQGLIGLVPESSTGYFLFEGGQ
ncbi:hypothetical protein JOE11_005125 [Robbsia andropogonis]